VHTCAFGTIFRSKSSELNSGKKRQKIEKKRKKSSKKLKKRNKKKKN